MENLKRTRKRTGVRLPHGEMHVANPANDAAHLDNTNMASDTRNTTPQEILSRNVSGNVVVPGREIDPELASNPASVQPYNACDTSDTKKQVATTETDRKEIDIRSSSRIRNRTTRSKTEKPDQDEKPIEEDKLVRYG